MFRGVHPPTPAWGALWEQGVILAALGTQGCSIPFVQLSPQPKGTHQGCFEDTAMTLLPVQEVPPAWLSCPNPAPAGAPVALNSVLAALKCKELTVPSPHPSGDRLSPALVVLAFILHWTNDPNDPRGGGSAQ